MKKLVLNKKFNIKNLEIYQKLNFIAILICLFFVASLSIGYAILSQNLDIKGDVTLRTIKDIRVMSIGEFTSVDGGYDIYNPTYTENSITTKVDLPNLTSTVTYTGTIVNNGTVPMEIKSIINTSMTNENIVYELSNVAVTKVISSGETLNFTITFKYKDGLTSVPIDQTLGSIITFEFIEHEENIYEYVKNGMLLDLRGTDTPVNNVWYDRVSNQEMKLKDGVVYDETKKCYIFSGSSYASLEKSILPITGDFTLEVRFSFPEDITTNIDQSIVAQISDTSNDTGRFKINAKYENNKSSNVLAFYNDKVGGTNRFIYFTSNASARQEYVAQITRTQEKFNIYLNGINITVGGNYPFDPSSPISTGPFKIAKWNNTTPQYYHGYISAVRVYNRVLSDDELINNKNVDSNLYEGIVIDPEYKDNLFKYAKEVQNVNNNGFLYQDNLNNYIYRGTNINNFVKIQGDSDLYRIVGYDQEGHAKLINTTTKFNIPFDESGNRNSTDSTYCDMASSVADTTLGINYGCNAWNSFDSFNNNKAIGNVANNATSNTYLNETYYATIPDNTKSKIVNHDFPIGIAVIGENRDQTNARSITKLWNGKIALISLADALNASINSVNIGSGTTDIQNYLIAGMGTTDVLWTLTADTNNTYDVYTLVRAKSIGRRRASRNNQTDGDILLTMYASPVFYIDAQVPFSGVGVETDPFLIK